MIRLDDIYREWWRPGVAEDTLEFLYSLLAAREPHVNISHRTLPTFQRHREFVESRPYAHWWLIMREHGTGTEKVGSCYLTKANEIGIHILSQHRGKGYGSQVVRMIVDAHPDKRLLANINPANFASIALFAAFGFTHCQNTYERLPCSANKMETICAD